MKATAIAVLLALTACGTPEPDGRADTIPLFFGLYLEPPPPDVLEGVGMVWGMEVVEVDNAYGAVHVYTLRNEDTGGAVGETHSTTECASSLWTEPRTYPLAHELGHAFGLGHVDDSSNIMDPRLTGERVTEEQIDTARFRSWQLQRCREHI